MQWVMILSIVLTISACASRPMEPIEKVGEEPTAIHTVRAAKAPKPQQAPTETPLTIPRYILEVIQAQGPGRFLQRVPVVPYRQETEFIGFQILELFPGEGLRIQSIQKGDVVTKINGKRVDRPEQFMKLFEELHLWNQVSIQFERQGVPMNVVYHIK